MSKKFETIAGNFEAEKTLEIFLMENPEIADSIGLSTEQLKKYLEIKLSTKEQEGLKSGEIGIETLKGKLINSSLEKRESQQALKNNQEKYSEIRNITDNEQQISEENAEETIMRELETQSGRQLDGKTEKAIQKVTDIAAKGGDSLSSGVESLKNTGAISAIAGFFLDGFKEVINWFKEIFNTLGNFIEKLMGKFFGKGYIKKELANQINSIKEESEEYTQAYTLIEDHTFKTVSGLNGTKLDEEQKRFVKKRLNPNEENSYLSKDDIKKIALKIKNGEKITKEDLDALNIFKKILNDKDPIIKDIIEDKLKKIQEELLNTFKKELNSSGIKINEGSDKENKLKNIIKKQVSGSKISDFIDKRGGSFLDFPLMTIETSLFIPNIIFEMWKEDIISIQDFTIGAVKAGGDRLYIGLKTFQGADFMPEIYSEITFDDLEDKIAGLNPNQKVILLRSFYSELGLVSSILGGIGYFSSSGIINLFEKVTANGITSLSSSEISKISSNFEGKQVLKLEKILNKLEPNNAKWLKEIKNSLVVTKESFEILGEIKNPNTSEIQKKILIEKLGKKKNDIDRIKKQLEFFTKGDKFKKASSFIQYGLLRESVESLESMVKVNYDMGTSIFDGNPKKYFHSIKQSYHGLKLRNIGGNVVMHLSKTDDLRKLSSALKDLSPGIIKTLFGRVPMILLGKELYNEAYKSIKGEGDSELRKTILSFNGFLGGFVLLDQAKVNFENGDFEIIDAATGTLGMVVIGAEFKLLTGDILKYSKRHGFILGTARAAFNSITRMPVEMANTMIWGTKRGNELIKIFGSIAKKHKRKGIIGLLLIVSCLILNKVITEEEVDSIILEDGSVDTKIFLEKWEFLKREEKENILKMIFITSLPKEFKNELNSENKTPKISFSLSSDGKTFDIYIQEDFIKKEGNLEKISESILKANSSSLNLNLGIETKIYFDKSISY